MHRIVWATLLFLPASAPLIGIEEGPRATTAQLIERLGNPDFAVREAAGKELLNLGPSAIPDLRRAADHSDAEVRRRVEGIIPTLERAAALEPKRVSLRLTRKPIRDAVAELAKQTGYSIKLDSDRNRDKLLYTFDLDKVTFWEAMSRLMEAGGLTLQADDPQGFQLVHSERNSPYVRHNGIARLTAQGFQYNRGIDFSQLPRNGGDAQHRSETLSFSFLVTTEPKVPLLGLGEVKLASAYDEKNRSMLPPVQLREEPNEFLWAGAVRRFRFALMDQDALTEGSSKTHSLSTSVNLVRPALASEKLKSIKGTVMATLLVEQRPDIVVDDPLSAKGKKFTSGKVTLTIGETRGNPNGDKTYRMKIHVTDGNAKNGHHQYHWVNTLPEHFELIDDKGKKFHSEHSGWEHADASQAQIELMFMNRGREKLGKPVKLIYYKWITMQHPLEFEFTDLPLP